MESLLDQLQHPLLKRFEPRDAAFLFDLQITDDMTDVEINEGIIRNVERAKRLASNKVNMLDVISRSPIPDITTLSYPSYYVHELDNGKAVVFELFSLEQWLIGSSGQESINPYTNRPFQSDEVVMIFKRVAAARLLLYVMQLDERSDRINRIFTAIGKIRCIHDYKDVSNRIRTLTNRPVSATDRDLERLRLVFAVVSLGMVVIIEAMKRYNASTLQISNEMAKDTIAKIMRRLEDDHNYGTYPTPNMPDDVKEILDGGGRVTEYVDELLYAKTVVDRRSELNLRSQSRAIKSWADDLVMSGSRSPSNDIDPVYNHLMIIFFFIAVWQLVRLRSRRS